MCGFLTFEFLYPLSSSMFNCAHTARQNDYVNESDTNRNCISGCLEVGIWFTLSGAKAENIWENYVNIMAWVPGLLASPDYRQSWYWLCWIRGSFCSIREDSTTHGISGSRNDRKKMYIVFPQNDSACIGLNPIRLWHMSLCETVQGRIGTADVALNQPYKRVVNTIYIIFIQL